jgi:hypothetical protein
MIASSPRSSAACAYDATTCTSSAASTTCSPSARNRSGSGRSCCFRISGHAAACAAASITATARAGVLNVITRWIARATANNPFTGSPARDFLSVGISRKPRARRLVALATSVRSDIAAGRYYHLAMWRPRFIVRFIEREKARPKTKLDIWVQKQREYVLRLPKWLVGTWTVSSFAFAIWCAVYNRGFMSLVSGLYRTPGYDEVFAICLTVIPLFIVLYGIARLLKPPAPTNLPSARVRD